MSKVPYFDSVGHLMYLMVCTKFNITHDVSLVRKYVNLKKEHWYTVKWILRYLASTCDLGILFDREGAFVKVLGYMIQVILETLILGSLLLIICLLLVVDLLVRGLYCWM